MAASDRYSTYPPSAKLVLAAVDLADFFMMVGKAAYEDQWVAPQLVEAGLTAQKRTNADHSRIMAVAEDMRLAGAAGIIQAAVIIDVPPPPSNRF
ncbi:MAG: hypothetical protein INR62_06845 [Rhodospirillales bacterium]|nr:hypothetical protein [Acetobacter sp.]